MYRVLALLLALLLPLTLAAESSRSMLATPSRMAYIRTTSIGVGASAEAVSLVGLTGFGANNRSFSVCFENEDSTAGDNILVQFVESGSVTASELTTPADATIGTVFVVKDAAVDDDRQCFDVQGVGWIWQSEANAVTAGAAWVTY